ncbi:MAG: hypothetical protein AB1374_02925 [Bacillota bacterium]
MNLLLREAKKRGYLVSRWSKDWVAYRRWCIENDKPFIAVKLNPKTAYVRYDLTTCNPSRCFQLNDAGLQKVIDFLKARRPMFKDWSLFCGELGEITLKTHEGFEETVDFLLSVFAAEENWERKPPRYGFWTWTEENLPCPKLGTPEYRDNYFYWR